MALLFSPFFRLLSPRMAYRLINIDSLISGNVFVRACLSMSAPVFWREKKETNADKISAHIYEVKRMGEQERREKEKRTKKLPAVRFTMKINIARRGWTKREQTSSALLAGDSRFSFFFRLPLVLSLSPYFGPTIYKRSENFESRALQI